MGKPEPAKDQKNTAAPKAAEAAASESNSPSSELQALSAKLSEYENDLKRLAAEFDNYKKRVEKEKSAAHAHGKAEAMAPFIDMAETFEQALAHAEKAAGAAGDPNGQTVGSKAMHDGLSLLHKKLHSIFASMGVREIECKGLPNHAFHEVMLQVSGGTAGEIAQTLRKGYVMGEHVLRPAQVSVYAGEEKKAEKQVKQAEKENGQEKQNAKESEKGTNEEQKNK